MRGCDRQPKTNGNRKEKKRKQNFQLEAITFQNRDDDDEQQ